MALVFHQAETCARTEYNIMITGETGVGKGLLARAIHTLSLRSSGPFVAVNMPAFTQTLFEDDFFGHMRGAYTGAVSDRRGFFEAAQGGTLFLDEITELVPAVQGKLLQVIEEKEFYRLGSTDLIKVDLRLLSASNRDLDQLVRSGAFRGDLYYRLNEFHIHIPPLRQRKNDILPLAKHFLRSHAEKNNKRIGGIDPVLVEALVQYPYPGNVRELENIVASAVLAENGRTLSLNSVPQLKNLPSTHIQGQDTHFKTLAEIQQRHIERALEVTDGNRTRAAKLLGIGLRTLQRKLKRYR
jgi:transcriptional regulator with PAS, ATPase and Fis domain